MSSRPKWLRLSCRKVCELWCPDDETNPDECDGIGDNLMVNEETEARMHLRRRRRGPIRRKHSKEAAMELPGV
uniref:Uncharacterized protein n=1 Tax=Caenorhabditis japonica TaxID=281687 RepID=A0A8R1EMW5_CAEJA